MASMAGERRRCCLKIAEEEILPVSLEVQERRLLLLLQGSWADVPLEPLLGMPCEQSCFSHVLIIPSSSSTSMGSVGTAFPSPTEWLEAISGWTWPGKRRKCVCMKLGDVVSTCRLCVQAHSETPATDTSVNFFSEKISTGTYICLPGVNNTL